MKLNLLLLAVMCSLVGLGLSATSTTAYTASTGAANPNSPTAAPAAAATAAPTTSGAWSTIFASSGGNVRLLLAASVTVIIPLLMK